MSSITLSTQLSSSLIDERTPLVSMFFLSTVHRSIGAEDNAALVAAPTAVVPIWCSLLVVGASTAAI
jgi:hypothetical protein